MYLLLRVYVGYLLVFTFEGVYSESATSIKRRNKLFLGRKDGGGGFPTSSELLLITDFIL